MVLTAANSFVGGTTINDGVLDINNGAALSSGDIVLNGGTLRASQTLALSNDIHFFDNSAASVTAATGTVFTLAGDTFFHPGSVTTFGSSTDTGTIIFAPPVNSVDTTASVVVAGGTLSAASNQLGSLLSTTQSTVVNGGATLAFNDFFAGIRNLTGAGSVNTGVLSSTTLFLAADGATTQEFSGVISGAGKVEVSTAGIGTGTVILSGANTYTGGTEICACTILQLGNGGNTGSVLGDILNDGTLIFNRGNAYTFTGAITGAGDLIQAGNGTTILTANNGYTGNTTVNAGTLIVDGSIASSLLTTVNAGATLGGSGTGGNTDIVGGTLAPGSAGGSLFGPLTVAGSLSFTTASTYLIQVSPATAGLTNVSGTANLGGATVSAVFQPGSYVSRQYTILNAIGGLGGTTFNPTVVSNNSNLNSTLTYDANNVFLNIALNFAAPGGPLTGNQQNVANALTNFFNTNGGIPAAFASLGPAGLTIASGELSTGIIQSAVKADDLFLNLLLDRTIAGRAGGFTAPGSASPFAADDEALAYAAKRLATPNERAAYAMARKAPALLAAQPASRWSIWGRGLWRLRQYRRQRRGRIAKHHGAHLRRCGRCRLQGHAGYPARLCARRRRHQLLAGQRAWPRIVRPVPGRRVRSAQFWTRLHLRRARLWLARRDHQPHRSAGRHRHVAGALPRRNFFRTVRGGIPLRQSGCRADALCRGASDQRTPARLCRAGAGGRRHVCAELCRPDHDRDPHRARPAHRQILRDAGRRADTARPRRLGARLQQRPRGHGGVPDAARRQFRGQRRPPQSGCSPHQRRRVRQWAVTMDRRAELPEHE
jgi:autotransporter-associated beta strand protein